MVFRILFRYLANNEQLVQRLSESYPVRRAAQMLVAGFYKSKNLAQQHQLDTITPERFRSFVNSFKKNVQEGIQDARRELKKGK